MVNRRDFIKSSSLLGGSLAFARPASVFAAAATTPSGYFGVHPFVEQHPEAVFIMRTNVDYKTNSAACKQVGLDFGRTVLVPMDSTGVPVTRNIALKPNLTAHDAVDAKRGFTLEDTMGIATDVFFVEGIFDSLMELGVPGSRLHTRDVNGARVVEPRGYVAMAQRVGGTTDTPRTRSAGPRPPGNPGPPSQTSINTLDDANDEQRFVWKEVPGGVVYDQIPYLWPINARDSWTVNVAKFKAHEMGLTLTGKNLQGAQAGPFQRFCGSWPAIDTMQKLETVIKKECINPKVHEAVAADFKRHLKTIPRWNTPDFQRGANPNNEQYQSTAMTMELWAHRTIDNHAASTIGLHVVEGIYGRDGDFNRGPNPYGNENNFDGRAWDYMSNIVIFGMNPYLVDNVGHWLGGHEPGNFGLFHMAMERGKVGMLDPMNIPVYEWQDGVAVRRPLTSFTRTPLRTFLFQQVAKKEPLWHLLDEPYDYAKVRETKLKIPARPTTRVLNQHYPNANNPQLAIEFSVPKTGWVLVEILDRNGNNLEVISNSICDPGYHMAAWNTAKYASGNYQYRLRFNDTAYDEVHDLILNKA